MFAQVSTGTPPLGSFSSGPDVINLGNLNVHFAIPVFSKPGRGGRFFYNLGYESSLWSPVSSSGTRIWTPVANWGWRGQTDAAVGYVPAFPNLGWIRLVVDSHKMALFKLRLKLL